MRARVVFEAAGAPKEFLQDFLNKLLAEVRSYNGIKILKEKIEEPVQRGQLYTTFAELEIEFKDLETFLNFYIDYTPSVIEVIEPEKITLTNHDLNKFLNDLSHKIIQLMLMINNLKAENEMLKRSANIRGRR